MTADTSWSALKVLLVDDHAGTRELTRRMLGRIKITDIVEASSGEEGLRLFNERPSHYDLIVCDWNMPGLSGLEMFGHVRAQRPEIHFLMISGRVDPESVLTAKRSGVSAYIAKPFSPDELRRKLAGVLTAHRVPPSAAAPSGSNDLPAAPRT
jgi:two-component system, chemotaxis family, chemotaxis protein CheY